MSVLFDIIVVIPEILELSLLFLIFHNLTRAVSIMSRWKAFYEKGKIFKVFGDLVIEFEDENNDSKEKVGKFPWQ